MTQLESIATFSQDWITLNITKIHHLLLSYYAIHGSVVKSVANVFWQEQTQKEVRFYNETVDMDHLDWG